MTSSSSYASLPLPMLTTKNYDSWRIREGRAKSFIMSALDDAMLPKITGASNSKEAWDILQQAYQGNDKVKMVRLQALRN